METFISWLNFWKLLIFKVLFKNHSGMVWICKLSRLLTWISHFWRYFIRLFQDLASSGSKDSVEDQKMGLTVVVSRKMASKIRFLLTSILEKLTLSLGRELQNSTLNHTLELIFSLGITLNVGFHKKILIFLKSLFLVFNWTLTFCLDCSFPEESKQIRVVP